MTGYSNYGFDGLHTEDADPISLDLRETQTILDTLRQLYKERRTMRSVLSQTEEQIKRHQQQVHQSLVVMP